MINKAKFLTAAISAAFFVLVIFHYLSLIENVSSLRSENTVLELRVESEQKRADSTWKMYTSAMGTLDELRMKSVALREDYEKEKQRFESMVIDNECASSVHGLNVDSLLNQNTGNN